MRDRAFVRIARPRNRSTHPSEPSQPTPPTPPPASGPQPGGWPAPGPYTSPGMPYTPYGQPGMPGAVPYGQPPRRSTNGLAIGSLVSGIVCCLPPLGLILGLVALPQIRKNEQAGKGLAIAGITLSALSCLLLLVGLATGGIGSAWNGFQEGVDEASRSKSPFSLRTGQCFTDESGLDEYTTDVTIVDCARPHDGEATGGFKVTGFDRWPGEDPIDDLAQKRCETINTAYAMDTWAIPKDVWIYYYLPSSKSCGSATDGAVREVARAAKKPGGRGCAADRSTLVRARAMSLVPVRGRMKRAIRDLLVWTIGAKGVRRHLAGRPRVAARSSLRVKLPPMLRHRDRGCQAVAEGNLSAAHATLGEQPAWSARASGPGPAREARQRPRFRRIPASPSQARIREEYGVSDTVALEARKVLMAEGLAEGALGFGAPMPARQRPCPGGGSPAPPLPSRVRRQPLPPASRRPKGPDRTCGTSRSEQEPAHGVEVAERLGIEPGERVIAHAVTCTGTAASP
ncbi:hypothetical protein STANM309S_06207 [Streptomyces tanashiensis]